MENESATPSDNNSSLSALPTQPTQVDESHSEPVDVVKPFIRLSCIQVCNFRRLAQTRMDMDAKTTILVGSNNSGKTSLMTAVRNFLSDSPSFRAFDISQSKWSILRNLGEQWEAMDDGSEEAVAEAEIEKWECEYRALIECMPFIDLWFEAGEGAYNYVAPFITSLKWKGGQVGIRIRLEPVANSEELRNLAWRYREARAPVKELNNLGHAWPIDLLDYWLRNNRDLKNVSIYRLNPKQGPNEQDKNDGLKPQSLPKNSRSVDPIHLRKLIKVDFVGAQRGLGLEEDEARNEAGNGRPGLFSSQLVKFARQHLNVDMNGGSHQSALISAIANAQSKLDSSIFDALKPAIEDVEVLGYPGLHDPQAFQFHTRIRTADLLTHGSAVQYIQNINDRDESLPEHSIGLGYQNLQSLSFMLVSFRAARLNPVDLPPAAVHLVMVEEPEAHLHVQVQRNFSAQALKLLLPKEPHFSHLRSQMLITTHSSHLAHGDSLTRLRYVKRTSESDSHSHRGTEVINLGNTFGTDTVTRIFAERYFQVQHTDLFFADAVILVEGTAERMLVPLFIEREFPELAQKYLSYLDIGGSHAHRLKPLIERLGIPTVIITDIDPVVPVKTKERTDWVAAPNNGQSDLASGNDTLNGWHPKLTTFNDYATLSDIHHVWESSQGTKVRFAWQLPIKNADNAWPSSFEDALILSNIDWFKNVVDETDAVSGKKIKITGTLAKASGKVRLFTDFSELKKELHHMLRDKFNKGDFSAVIFEKMLSGSKIKAPDYISGALNWLQLQLKSPKGASK